VFASVKGGHCNPGLQFGQRLEIQSTSGGPESCAINKQIHVGPCERGFESELRRRKAERSRSILLVKEAFLSRAHIASISGMA
jgi:hypothetical protein